jgi:uncharacterized membrane protein YkvA (DUF1232 family)
MVNDPFPRDRAAELMHRVPAYLRLSIILAKDPLLSKARRAAIVGAAGYLISPIDLVPGIIPVVGQLDDIAVAIAAIKFALAGLSPERRRAHLEAVGLADDLLVDDLRTLGVLSAWVVRAGARTTQRAARAGASAAVKGSQAAARTGRAAAGVAKDRLPGAASTAATAATSAKGAAVSAAGAAGSAASSAKDAATGAASAAASATGAARARALPAAKAVVRRIPKPRRPGSGPAPELEERLPFEQEATAEVPLLPPPPPGAGPRG